ncbi:unnamed protein product, partial [Symbiodinium microadriaticum]
MAQLEGELREARLTLFGPMPSSKAGKAAPPPVDTVPPPKPALHSHWHNKQGKGKNRPWADVSDGDEWDDIPSSDAAPSSAPRPAPNPAPHPAPRPAQQPNMDVGWAAYFAYQKGVEKGKAQNPAYAPPWAFRDGPAHPRPLLTRSIAPHRSAQVSMCTARRRWAAQANQRQAQFSGNAAPAPPAQPCIDLSSQVTDSASLADAPPATLDYGDASPGADPFGDIAPTQLDSPCISVSSTEEVELLPPAPPCHSAVLLSLSASSKHPQHSMGASSLSVPKLLSHGPLPTVADLACCPAQPHTATADARSLYITAGCRAVLSPAPSGCRLPLEASKPSQDPCHSYQAFP